MSSALYWCLAALVIDCWACWKAIDSVLLDSGPWLVLVTRAAACLTFSMTLPGMLPRRLTPTTPAFFLLMLAIAFFIPVLGMAGSLACIVPALRLRHESAFTNEWQRVHVPDLPNRPAVRGQPGQPGQPSAPTCIDNLSSALRRAHDPKRRVAALIGTLALKAQHAGPLLRLALKDSVDDVRLLAYILLNRREKMIVERISKRTEQLQGGVCRACKAFDLHKALAHDYHELTLLAASTSSTAATFGRYALTHANLALLINSRDIDLQLLCGNIALHDDELDAALARFVAAQRAGLSNDQTCLLLAEIAFLRHGYAELDTHLANAAGSCNKPALRRQLAYWDAIERMPNDAVQS